MSGMIFQAPARNVVGLNVNSKNTIVFSPLARLEWLHLTGRVARPKQPTRELFEPRHFGAKAEGMTTSCPFCWSMCRWHRFQTNLPPNYYAIPPFQFTQNSIFLWFSYDFPIVLWFFYGFPMVFRYQNAFHLSIQPGRGQIRWWSSAARLGQAGDQSGATGRRNGELGKFHVSNRQTWGWS